ncbi:MAG: glycine--tRNA ligase subunit beta [Pseudomonadota bacterium]|uniref:Glycine--tRNA ligase beta subunit n=1 Tax=Candidatus Desulfatibia profunda TaxID=2841695 RepID=A0A8J6NR31_9BACT|nr:glycine--tRNA ligase subunit beta [Candidatus Desulfatibia profunda]MBL7178814.1 glycine--tRNA ligase subunit beta [Desulfobacterales bacterium]
MKTLLLEIGSEEIPAGYIEPALQSLSSTLLAKMTEARIEHGSVKVYGTPRRLAVEIKNVADKQKPLTSEMLGPPEKVGLDQEGHPTMAAEKFAEKVGVSVNALIVKDTEKGRYLCAKIIERGFATRTLLKKILPKVILAIPFPKTMKWAELDITFARPIHYIVALLGNQVIGFQVGATKSGRHSFGHYFMQPKKVNISSAADYVKILHKAQVYVDFEERRKLVEREINKAAKKVGGKVFSDEELVDINKNLVEYPIATAGKFDKEFLEIPGEILITAMRKHQKYFAVVDDKGKLMPCFIAVNNTRTRDLKLVATGHERVLRARLADAQFFFKSDVQESLDEWVERLKGVLFQAKLGTMYEKVKRVQKVAEYLADVSGQSSDLKKQVSRAAWLCKADLESQVVSEFPNLQGVMGRNYATIKKEPKDVAVAIEEHYRPTYSGGPLPETVTGGLLGIADKIDSICGFFSVGLIPTGASDPYALRRQGIGIIQIMHHQGFSFSLRELIAKSLNTYGLKGAKQIDEIADLVYKFLQNRMTHQLSEEGFSKDVIAAVADVSADNVTDVWNRVRALQELKTAPDFEPLAVAFKRVVNIIKKADLPTRKDVDTSLFENESESALYAAYKAVNNKVASLLEKGRLDQALREIASLRDSVDAFFDGVMVMVENKKIRNNRLSLLGLISDLFGLFADFAKIST